MSREFSAGQAERHDAGSCEVDLKNCDEDAVLLAVSAWFKHLKPGDLAAFKLAFISTFATSLFNFRSGRTRLDRQQETMELHLVAFFSSILFEASQAFPAPVGK